MREKPWDAQHTLPWEIIKRVWDSYWNHDRALLLEKSPPNIIRTQDILKHFQPAQFIIMVRNPYAQAEGLIRRNNWPVKRAANFAIMCLHTQWANRRRLNSSAVLTYESLGGDPRKTCETLAQFLPALSDLDSHASFEVHSIDGVINRPIIDLNAKKIATLPEATIQSLNEVFSQHRTTLDAWGYKLLTTRGPL